MLRRFHRQVYFKSDFGANLKHLSSRTKQSANPIDLWRLLQLSKVDPHTLFQIEFKPGTRPLIITADLYSWCGRKEEARGLSCCFLPLYNVCIYAKPSRPIAHDLFFNVTLTLFDNRDSILDT